VVFSWQGRFDAGKKDDPNSLTISIKPPLKRKSTFKLEKKFDYFKKILSGFFFTMFRKLQNESKNSRYMI